jgi:hypothetical protein
MNKGMLIASAAALALVCSIYNLHTQSSIKAIDGPAGVAGNYSPDRQTIAIDFKVTSPIVVTDLGVFDDGTNGISGHAVLTVQLYSREVEYWTWREAGALLETLTFDAGNPGVAIGASRYKPLAKPITLLPGL